MVASDSIRRRGLIRMDKAQVHWLHEQAFCEYTIYLEQIKGVKDPEAQELDEGTAVHTDLLEKHEAQATLPPMTTGEALEYSAKEEETVKMRELPVKGERLHGLIDEIWFTSKAVFIFDDKPRSPDGIPFRGEQRQAKGYCLAFSEAYPENQLPIVAAIRDRDKRDKSSLLWSQRFTPADKDEVNESLDRILGIINGSWDAVPTQNPRKCRRCRWQPFCDKAVA